MDTGMQNYVFMEEEMKNINRTILLLLALLFLLPTTACSGAAQQTQSNTSTPMPTVTPIPTPEPTEAPLPAIRPEPKSTLTSFVPGSLKSGGGYYSRTFDISIDLPQGWSATDKSIVHQVNKIEADATDTNALTDAYQEKLRQGSSVMEYFASRKDPSGFLIVMAREVLDADGKQMTEMDVLAQAQYWLLDMDQDGTIDVGDVTWVVVDAFGGKHLAYQFTGSSGGTQTYGMILAYQSGSLFELIELTSDVKGDIENILLGTREGS
jgi:hypothetical protein